MMKLGYLQTLMICNLYLEGNIKKKELYEKGYHYSVVSKSLKGLKENGLIKGEGNILELTDKGRTVVEGLEEG